jgi:hypothetical protein
VGAFTGEQVDSRMPFSPVASPAVASRGMESIGCTARRGGISRYCYGSSDRILL